jgi:hypothetical protein
VFYPEKGSGFPEGGRQGLSNDTNVAIVAFSLAKFFSVFTPDHFEYCP